MRSFKQSRYHPKNPCAGILSQAGTHVNRPRLRPTSLVRAVLHAAVGNPAALLSRAGSEVAWALRASALVSALSGLEAATLVRVVPGRSWYFPQG